MTYAILAEPVISYQHSYKSPIILRAEAIYPEGSLRVTEYQDHRPFIAVDGDQPRAREMFSYLCGSLQRYLDSHFMEDLNRLTDYPGLFEIDLRRPNYRILLGETRSHTYRALIFGKRDPERIRIDLREAHVRLCEVFRIHTGC